MQTNLEPKTARTWQFPNPPAMYYRFRAYPDGTIKFEYVSPNCFELNGVEAEAVLRDPTLLTNGIHPDDQASYWECARESGRTGKPFCWEGRFLVGGHIEWRRLEAIPETLPSGDVVWHGMQNNTTEQHAMMEALVESETRYRTVSELTSDYAFVLDVAPDGTTRRAWITDAFERITGFTPAESEARGGWAALTHPDDLPLIKRTLAKLLQKPSQLETEYRIITKSGEVKYMAGYNRSEADPETGRVHRIYGVAKDITERKRLADLTLERERLQLAYQQEHEMSRLKSQLMTRVSHEFRTPLAIIATCSEMLDRYRDRLSQEQSAERLQRIQAQVAHLAGILDNIQFIARAERGQHEHLELDTFEVSTLCARALADAERATQMPPLRVHCDIGVTVLTADQGLLHIILTNLLSNAIKFSSADVDLSIALDNGAIVIEVKDRGIGIPEADRAHVFEPFYRGSNAETISGIGLGLSLVQNAVMLHGGSVALQSELGSGTLVIVRIPLPSQDPFKPMR